LVQHTLVHCISFLTKVYKENGKHHVKGN